MGEGGKLGVQLFLGELRGFVPGRVADTAPVAGYLGHKRWRPYGAHPRQLKKVMHVQSPGYQAPGSADDAPTPCNPVLRQVKAGIGGKPVHPCGCP